MGNFLNCAAGSKKRKKSTIFCAADNPFVTTSFTTPSMCDGHSTTLSLTESAKTNSSESFSWGRMQNLVLQQESFSQDVLTPAVLKIASQVLDTVKRNIKTICDDLQKGCYQLPDSLFERFKKCLNLKQPALSASSINTTSITRKIIAHFVTALYVQDMILNFFVNGEQELALELLKQIAVSHALMGVTCSEFRVMDWFKIHCLVKSKFVNEESVNTYIIYLNICGNYITHFYESQRIREKMVAALTTEKKNDRKNKARENYRLMKKWKVLLETFKDQDKVLDEMLLHLAKSRKSIPLSESLDTLALKENDCIMKHFVQKKSENKESVSSQISLGYTNIT